MSFVSKLDTDQSVANVSMHWMKVKFVFGWLPQTEKITGKIYCTTFIKRLDIL